MVTITVVEMLDSSSEDEEEQAATRTKHGSAHLRGVPVVARAHRGLRLERPGRVGRVREAGDREARPLLHSPGAALRIPAEATRETGR